MKLKVYHAKIPIFITEGLPELNEDNFEMVAEVECPALDDAFTLTNHIDRPWWDNPGVQCFKQSRSTSVGDVIVVEDGSKFVCRPTGWGFFK